MDNVDRMTGGGGPGPPPTIADNTYYESKTNLYIIFFVNLFHLLFSLHDPSETVKWRGAQGVLIRIWTIVGTHGISGRYTFW